VQDSNPIGYVADLMAEERMFRQVGVGFGEIETFLIFNSVKKFVSLKSASQAKFWGKITGSHKDYYIIEATVEGGGEEEEITEPHEAKGTGVNAKQYFVSTDSKIYFFYVILTLFIVLDPAGWTELPLLMPRHIIQSRKIKHAFTGILDQKINSSPAFKGTEKEYVTHI
jgi:Radial spokehead-like protein